MELGHLASAALADSARLEPVRIDDRTPVSCRSRTAPMCSSDTRRTRRMSSSSLPRVGIPVIGLGRAGSPAWIRPMPALRERSLAWLPWHRTCGRAAHACRAGYGPGPHRSVSANVSAGHCGRCSTRSRLCAPEAVKRVAAGLRAVAPDELRLVGRGVGTDAACRSHSIQQSTPLPRPRAAFRSKETMALPIRNCRRGLVRLRADRRGGAHAAHRGAVQSGRSDLRRRCTVRLRRKNARPAAGVWTHGVRARRGGRDRVWPQVARSAAVGVRTPTAA